MPTDKKLLSNTSSRILSSPTPRNLALTGCPDNNAVPADLAQVLRITPEPLQQIDDYSVHRLICGDLPGYLNYLHQGLQEIGHGTAQLTLPPKQLFQQPGERGDFRVMPCVRRAADGRVHKTVKLVGTNRVGQQVPDQITVGKANYLHPEENFVSHQFDACLLSSIRTGAGAALASQYLLNHNDQAGPSVTLMGAGRVGYYTLICLLSKGLVTTVELCDPSPGRAENLALLLGNQWPALSIKICSYSQISACDLTAQSLFIDLKISRPAWWSASVPIALNSENFTTIPNGTTRQSMSIPPTVCHSVTCMPGICNDLYQLLS